MPPTRRLSRDARGVAIVEFALLLPVLLLLLLGMLAWGQYFWLAHSAQQIANDAARATVAGLTADERSALATAAVRRATPQLPELARASVRTRVQEQPQLVAVSVSFDAGELPLLRLSIVPVPSPLIERHAAVRPGGVQ